MGYTVRTATHRFTEWRDSKQDSQIVARELYEYSEDGIERINLADRPEYAEIQNELQTVLRATSKPASKE